MMMFVIEHTFSYLLVPLLVLFFCPLVVPPPSPFPSVLGEQCLQGSLIPFRLYRAARLFSLGWPLFHPGFLARFLHFIFSVEVHICILARPSLLSLPGRSLTRRPTLLARSSPSLITQDGILLASAQGFTAGNSICLPHLSRVTCAEALENAGTLAFCDLDPTFLQGCFIVLFGTGLT